MAHLEITLERMANMIDTLTDKISKQTDLLKDINFSQNSEETKKYPWATGLEKKTKLVKSSRKEPPAKARWNIISDSIEMLKKYFSQR